MSFLPEASPWTNLVAKCSSGSTSRDGAPWRMCCQIAQFACSSFRSVVVFNNSAFV